MMYLAEIAFSIILFVLLGAICLVIWSLRNEGSAGAATAKFFGIAVSILAILTMVCTLYYGYIYMQEGYFKSPMPMMDTMQRKGMSDNHKLQP